jgi:predicted dehydrogenase
MSSTEPILSELNRRGFLRGSSFAALMAMMGGVEITAQDNPKTLAIPKADPNFKEKPPGPPVNFGVIGVGAWGREILATLARQPNAPVVGVAETYAASLRRAEEAAPKATRHEDHRKLLEQPDVKAVVVATPSHQHKAVAIAALEAGKHVYCEAPLASTIADARAIAQAAKAHPKQIFQVGLQFRGNPQHHHVQEFVRTGAPGKLTLARSQWHKKQSWRRASPNGDREKALNWRLDPAVSPGLMGELGIHQVDVASWYSRSLPVAVTGFGGVLHWSDGRTVPDTIHAVVEYPGGFRWSYDCTLTNSFDGNYDLFAGTDAAIMLRENRAWMFKEADSPLLGWEVYARKDEFFGSGETGIALVANATKLLAQGKKPAEALAHGDTPLFYALEEFINNINDNKPPSCGFKEGFEAAVTAIKANEAVVKGTRITLEKSLFEV